MAQSPLHDIFDPYGTATGRNGKDPTIEDLMPEEEKSALLHYLSNLGSNGIAGAGWLLDTPGAVVRGLLSGGPLKALSALGETTEDRVTGRELARQHGLIGDEDNWGNFFGGVGAEMLLDPLTYFGAGLIGHGAKTVGGGILKKSGAMKWMPSTLMERNADAIASGGSRVGPREFARKTTVGDFVDMLPPEVAGSHKAQLMLLAKEHAAKPLSTVERLLGQKRLTAQELLNSPISKMNRVSIPGLETGSADLFGERFSDAASKALDAAGESMQTMPGIGKAVRTVNAAFVPGYGDELDLADQRARYVGEARRQAALVPKSFAHNKAVYDAQAEHLAEMANWKATHESTVASLRAEQDAIEAAIRAGGPLPPNTMGRRYDIRKELERQADLALSGGPVGMNEPEYIRAFNNAATGGNEVWGDIPVPNHSPTILGVHSPEQIAANTSDAKLRLAMQMLDPQGAPNAQKALVKHQLDTLELARIKQKQLALDVNESSSRHSRPTAEILYGPREKLFFDNPQAAPPSPGSLPTSAKEQVLVSGGRQVTPLSDQHSMARGHHMDVLGGDEVLNAMSRDAKLQDALRAAASHDVPGIFHKWMSERYAPWLARSTNASPGNPLYGWLDDLDAMGEFKHSVPDGAVNMSNTPEGIALSNINSKISRVPEEQLAKTGASIGTPKELQELIANLSMAGAIKDPERLFHTNLLNKHYGTLLQDQNAAQLAFDTAKRGAYMGKMYDDLANTYRTLDPQHAKTGIPIFGVHPANSLDNYQRSRSTLESSARMLLDKMISKAVVSPGLASVPAVDRVIGGTHYSLLQAANELGFDPQQFEKLVLNEFPSAKTANDISIPKSAVDPLTKRLRKASPRPELQYVRDALDRYTKSFKTLALLSPSRWSRDRTSGAIASYLKGLYSYKDRAAGVAAGRGDYGPLTSRLEGVSSLASLTPEQRVRHFLSSGGANGLRGNGPVSELASDAPSSAMRDFFPGSNPTRGVFDLADSIKDTIRNPSNLAPWSIRTASGNKNPILEFGDRMSQQIDDANRIGAYLTALRQGNHPAEAKRLADLTQVNYHPESFTSFEKNVLKPLMPFYSYTKGIIPLVAEELTENPAGKMGKAIRAMNRSSEPKEGEFVPEHLRQSSSLGLPEGIPFVGLPQGSNLKRYLAKIDLPFEGPLNLITPGTGTTILDKLASGAYKTSHNIAGMLHPLVKAPVELMTNRQFYSGRQMSDLYSMLEANSGVPSSRYLEHMLVNTPGGSKLLGVVRQVMDDRLPASSKLAKYAFKSATGMTMTDVDSERTKQQAARNMLTDMLQKTPGVKTYESITIPEDKLREMPIEKQKLYLLYRSIQAEASRKARERKKAEGFSPMHSLGLQ